MALDQYKLQKIVTAAQERVSRRQAAEAFHPFKIVFVPDGILYVRFLLDSAGEYVRTFLRHKHKNISAHCLGPDDCRICQELNNLLDENWNSRYLFEAKEISICYAWISDAKDVQANSEYIVMNEHVLLMGKQSLANVLSEYITDFGDLDLVREFFSPNKMIAPVELKCQRFGNDLVMEPAYMKVSSVDPLPEEFPPLSEIFFREGSKPDDRFVDQFIRKMRQSYQTEIEDVTGHETFTAGNDLGGY
ncbi:hypothetical protein ACFL2Q_00140 [Thermodesulfobacteriota bacterium]